MDHSHMDHGNMDHGNMDHGDMGGGHGGHGDMGGGAQCSMNMLFTWDTNNLCIVFRQWRIDSTASLVVSLLLVVALTAGYEALRAASRRYEQSVDKRVIALPTGENGGEPATETTPFLWTGSQQVEATRSAHIVKAALYALQNFYAFMIMLIFMTYNGWVMVAVAFGAFVGYVLFGNSTSSTKDNACH